MSNKPIIPIFSGERMHGETIEGHYFRDTWMDSHEITLQDDVQSTHHIKPETLRISLDNGKEWHAMERVEELIELGLQYEHALESLAKENDDDQ